jgi:histidine triad (HIT) family protein
MSSIFSKIISGEIPCYKVAENDEFLAFLDIMPLRLGHVLVIPKRETDYIFDIADDELSRFMVFSKYVAQGIKQIVPCKKIGVTVIGLEVPHAHIHLVPIDSVADMNFAAEKQQTDPQTLAELASKIAAVLK